MKVRQMRSLRAAGESWAAIAAETGCDYRTVKKYLGDGAPTGVPTVAARKHPPKVIEPFCATIDEWLRAEPRLRGTVIHQRLVAEHGFTHSYQRVKMYLAEARPRLCPSTPELHRRFEVLPGAQAQVDWGDEGTIDTEHGPLHVYSFHMTLSYSRDPFCRFVTSMDLVTFWECHVAAFRHFGGVPATVLYDRTKTVVRRHVGPGQEVPLHPEAIAMAAHYGFSIVVAAAYRPQAKGRVERQVDLVRHGVLMGRSFDALGAMNDAFMVWLRMRRQQVHRTHGEVISQRAELDRARLGAMPRTDYRVTERHLRTVGKDCLVSFEGSLYSVPWRLVRRPMRVEVRVGATEIALHRTGGDHELLCTHERARVRGTWVVDQAHWEGLPDGRSRPVEPDAPVMPLHEDPALVAVRSKKAAVSVARRDLAYYDLVGAA